MSVAEHEIYYNNCQLPIFFFFLVILWTPLILRLRSIQLADGWRTWKAASAVLAGLAGLLCIVYVALLVSNYAMNRRIEKIRGKLLPGDVISPDPTTYSENQVRAVWDATEALMIVRFSVHGGFESHWIILKSWCR